MELVSIGTFGLNELVARKELYDALMLFLQKNTVNIKAYGDVTVEHPTPATELAQGVDILCE